MEEWKEYRLGDIVTLVIDYRGKTPLKLGGNWSLSGYRALSAKNIKTGVIVNEDSIRYVDEELYRKWMKDEVERGDIFVTSEAPFGQIFYWDSDEKIVLSQRLFCLRFSEKVCSRFVYYYMTTKAFQSELDGRATGTTVVGLRQPELLKCKIKLPPLHIQKQIAFALSSLDDKIEINRRINENLEQQAQALFKSWFVDFEPFRDQPFVESELGMIPEGWRVVNLHEIVDIKRDNYKKGDDATLPYLPIDIIPMHSLGIYEFKDNKEAQSSLQTFEKNDIIIGAMRVYFHRVVIAPCKGITRNTCFVLKPKNQNLWAYSIMQCNQNETIDFANRTSKGSTMPYAIWNNGLANYRIVLPNKEILSLFNRVVSPILEKVRDSYRINTIVSQLRDTLLPRLMSGDLKVLEIEESL